MDTTSKPNRALFLDRDGTIMEDVGYCSDPGDVRIFPGVPDALRSLKLSGWKIVIVTNQSGVARGYFTEKSYEAVAREVERQLGGLIDATYVSFDGPDSDSPRRKPGTGMLEEASRDLGIDLSESIMVGDKASDIECGRRAGCGTFLVLTGEGQYNLQCWSDAVVTDLVSAVLMVQKLDRMEEGE